MKGEGDLSGIWDTTFENHEDKEFWDTATGRMGVQGNCQMVHPLFLVGKTYLILLGGDADTKQFERIDSGSDRWLSFVKDQLRNKKR